MNAERKTQFKSGNLRPEAWDALKQAALDLTSAAGRRITLSDMILAALRVARRHEAELIAALSPEENP